MPNTRYDLPLAKDSLAQFQMALTCTMTVLSLWILAGFIMLSDTSDRWTTTLQNTALVEIPALADAQADPMAEDIQTLLNNIPFVTKTELYKKEQVQELIKAWINPTDDALINYPRFISVTLANDDNDNIRSLEKQLKEIDENLIISQNKDQLKPLFSMINSTRFVAGLAIILLFSIILICIAFAVRARMRMYKNDIEILHTLGASANYIANQFQRQSLIIGLKGATLGFFIGGGSMLLMLNFWPGFYTLQQHALGLLNVDKLFMFIVFPIAIAAASALMARITAHNILGELP